MKSVGGERVKCTLSHGAVGVRVGFKVCVGGVKSVGGAEAKQAGRSEAIGHVRYTGLDKNAVFATNSPPT